MRSVFFVALLTALVSLAGNTGCGMDDHGAVDEVSQAAMHGVAGTLEGARLIESITAYGKYYNHDVSGGPAPRPTNGNDLTSVPRYASGPCEGKEPGTCTFGTRTFANLSQGRVESITAYGRYFNFNVDAGYAPWSSNGNDLTQVPRYADGPCKDQAAGCAFDTRTFATINGRRVESITAYGKYYNFDADNGYAPRSTNGSDLGDVPRYADGPCEGKDVCVFDTRTFAISHGKLVESITAYGRYFNFDVDDGYAPWSSNGNDLTQVPRYATGPCEGLENVSCVFDTRAFVTINGRLIESISAYGKYYNFDVSDGPAPWPTNGNDLTRVRRYAAGPCEGKEPGTCTFDTRAFVGRNGGVVESITAYGKYFNFDNGLARLSNGNDLTEVPRYANGPCEGKETGTCTFDTRTFVIRHGRLVESITAYGKYFNFDVDDDSRPWSTNGNDLTEVPRYASGPCEEKETGTCTFDTRTFVFIRGKLVESITAHGKYFNFDVEDGFAPWPSNGNDLTEVPRYASGPCKDATIGSCRLDTRTFLDRLW
ncbi:hypothetical protein ACFL6C_13200 [Myxococcota bacterium]